MRSATLLSAALVAALVLHFGLAATGGHFIADASPAEDVYHLSILYERWAAHLLDGHLPIWMPEFGAGYPAPASWMYGLLSPGLGLFLALPVELAWTWTGILHIAFGSLGMLLLVREHGARSEAAVVAGLLFGLSEFMVGRVACGHLNLVMPLAWAPWVLWQTLRAVRAKRGGIVGLGVCGAMGLLSGHVQVWFYVAPLAGLLAVVTLFTDQEPRGGRRIIRAAALVVALTAIQWLPALELVRVSDAQPVSLSVLNSTSAPPLHVLSRLVPGSLGWRVIESPLLSRAGPYWMPEALEHEFLWIGGPWVALLALMALMRPDRTRVFWVLVVGAGIGLGVGTYAPWGEIAHAIPPLSFGRTPGRGLVLAVLALPVLAGLGVDTWLAGLSEKLSSRWRLLALPLGLTGAGVIAALVTVRSELHALGDPIETWAGDMSVADIEVGTLLPAAIAAVAGLGAVALGLVLASREGPRRWLPAILVGAAAWFGALPPVESVPVDFHRVDWQSQFPEAARTHRLHLFLNRFPPVEMAGMRTVRELCHVDERGFRQLWTPPSSGAAYWLDVRTQAIREWEGAVFEPPIGAALADLITVDEFPTIGAGALFELGGAPAASDPAAIAADLQAGTVELFLSSSTGERVTRHAPLNAGHVRSLPSDSPLVATFEVDAPQPAWAVVSEKHYPGWSATVDGTEVPVRRANLALRAVQVGPGRHRVEFVYRPATYRVGGWLGGIAALVAIGLFWRTVWKDPSS